MWSASSFQFETIIQVPGRLPHFHTPFCMPAAVLLAGPMSGAAIILLFQVLSA
jgi:hypothetical protein